MWQNKIKYIKTILNNHWLFIIVFLFLISGVLSYIISINILNDFLNYMSGLATIIIALLTGMYVLTTTRQLDVMGKQLNEMEFSRNLQTQPLPIIENIECYTESPRVFHQGGRKIVVSNRIHLKGNIENIGIGSAVSIDVIPELICKYPNGTIIKTSSERFDFIKEKESCEYNELFNEEKGEFLDTILDGKIDSLPVIELTIYYKNVLGGFFKSLYKYRIYPFEKDNETIKKWLRNMKMFEFDFSEDLKQYNHFIKTDSSEAHIYFEKIQTKFENNLSKSKLDLSLHLIPGSFYVNPITEEEFYIEIEKKEIWYSTLVCVGKQEKIDE